MFIPTILAILSAANTAFGAPTPFGFGSFGNFSGFGSFGNPQPGSGKPPGPFGSNHGSLCPVSNATLTLPQGQTALTLPQGSPVFIGVAMGTQNYTCDSTGKNTTYNGAFAKLFDISCFVNTPMFAGIQDKVFEAVGDAKGQDLIDKVLSVVPTCPMGLGDHFHIANPVPGATGLSPVWDFRTAVKKDDPNGYITAKEAGTLDSPAGPSNIKWVRLDNIGGQFGGSLASTVMRVDTKGGQPPSTCKPGEQIITPYATKYWLFK